MNDAVSDTEVSKQLRIYWDYGRLLLWSRLCVQLTSAAYVTPSTICSEPWSSAEPQCRWNCRNLQLPVRGPPRRTKHQHILNGQQEKSHLSISSKLLPEPLNTFLSLQISSVCGHRYNFTYMKSEEKKTPLETESAMQIFTEYLASHSTPTDSKGKGMEFSKVKIHSI